MSKKRLYEIAKELGKSSKEVVEYAQELGLDVKSHSSSVDESDAKRIAAKFSGNAKPAAAKVKVEKAAEKPVAEAPKAAPAKPQSRNFKAEREARAKAEAEKRAKGGDKKRNNNQGRDNRSNRDRQENAQNNRKQRDRNSQNHNRRDQQRDNRQRDQRNDRNQAAKPRIDFKARAAALKAEQNAEYSRQSENRIHEKEATKRKAKAAKTAAPAPKHVVAEQAAPAVDKHRKKQAHPEKSRDYERDNEDGPRKNRKNWNNHNQVRNQKNSNWNNNKKNKKGKHNNRNNAPKPVTERKFHELPKEFEYTEGMTVAEIAKRIKREPAEIVKKLFLMGVMATQNQSLDSDTIELLMVDYGIEAHKKVEVDEADIERFFADEGYLNPDEMVERAPVVTIMGHVDHGKTTLLDTLRNSRVATGEAGGITQHIGAYQIVENGKKITFLDTPGHAAFTSMRARGASITDITILIVAADDGVMPQTVEAINHSKAAGVPIIVAINKIDKPGANPERVIGELAEHGIISTAWGGDCEFVEISAKFGKNIDELLETVLLVAEMEELKADPTVRAIGTVIEARLDKGKGPVATLLVQQGTLHVQDPIVVGNTFGRVRALAA